MRDKKERKSDSEQSKLETKASHGEDHMKKRWIVLILFILLFVAIFQGIIPTSFTEERPAQLYETRESQLSAYSDDWNGLSSFRTLLEQQSSYEVATIISNPLILEKIPRPNETLLISVGMEKQYDPLQAQSILAFVKRGGRVLLMDDFGQASSLSKKFGIEFTGKQIWSLDFEKNVSFIKRTASFDGEKYSLLFNSPSILKKSEKETIFEHKEILSTTKDTWIDDNKNGKLDMMEGDTQAKEPMIMEALLNGENRVLCIADASLFINDMIDKNDNKQFSLAVVRHLLEDVENATIIFDESRHIQENLAGNIFYNFENGYIYLIHLFFVTETGSDTINMAVQAGKLIVLGVLFYIFSLFYVGTKNPKDYKTRYDPTYHVDYEFGGRNRTTRLYHLINESIQKNHGLIFVDPEHVYDGRTKQVFSLKDKKVLKDIIHDPVLEKFYLRPEREYPLEKITEIYNRVIALRSQQG